MSSSIPLSSILVIHNTIAQKYNAYSEGFRSRLIAIVNSYNVALSIKMLLNYLC